MRSPTTVENTTEKVPRARFATMTAETGAAIASNAQNGQVLRTSRVGAGSFAPKSANMAANTGALMAEKRHCAEKINGTMHRHIVTVFSKRANRSCRSSSLGSSGGTAEFISFCPSTQISHAMSGVSKQKTVELSRCAGAADSETRPTPAPPRSSLPPAGRRVSTRSAWGFSSALSASSAFQRRFLRMKPLPPPTPAPTRETRSASLRSLA